MAGPVIHREDFGVLMSAAIGKIFDDSMKTGPREYAEIFEVEGMDGAYETEIGFTGFGPAPQKPEGTSIRYDNPLLGFPVTYIPYTYALGAAVTMEARQDEKHGKLGTRLGRGLARSVILSEETAVAGVFANAFTLANGPDGRPLIATDHPLVRGPGTGANRTAGAAALSQASLNAAIIRMSLTPDQSGNVDPYDPMLLVVPPALYPYAIELVKSTLKPDTANNNINSTREIAPNLRVKKLSRLTSQTIWFLVSKNHQLKFKSRMAAKFESDNHFDTGTDRYKVTRRFVVGFSDWRGIDGNPGA